MADAAWSSVPTALLREELQRRAGADGQKPQCGSRQKGWYDTAAHVFALLLILALSTLACGFPLISRRTTTGKRQRTIIFYCQHVGTGVLLATAFVHLLPTAFVSLTDPCLPYFFNKGYTPLAGLVAMVSAIIVVGVESYLTARGAGHSHSHAHGFFDADDSSSDALFHHVDLDDPGSGLAERRAVARRPMNISLDDMEATGLVAGVSPLPGSTPPDTGAAPRKSADSDRDAEDDSDLDLEASELNHVVPATRGDGRHPSPKPGDGGAAVPDTPTHPTTEEQARRQLLQCLLLEAGILFHSVFIGMAISVATGAAFVVFLVAISFHQSFEGLALGSRIAAVQFPRGSVRPWLMVLAYGVTTPIGQAIGLMVHRMYDPASMGGLLVVGFMNAVSSGLLLYAGLVQLLAEDFLTEKSYRVLRGRKRLHAYLAVVAGALLMALVGAFA